MPQSRTADIFHYLTLLPLSFLALVVIISLLVIRTPLRAAPSHRTPRGTLVNTPPPPTTTSTTPAPPSYPTAEQLKAQDDRFSSALDVLKDRASSQQTLIATITTLTGLYVVILSFAAYFRLQQTREESKEAVKANQKAFDDAKSDYTNRFDDIKENLKNFESTTRSQITDLQTESRTKVTALITEVRTDIPALHGIGRRLEQLLAELDSRLPVDGDWTNATTYDQLNRDDREQAFIDEMIINSLDIFNVTQDIGSRRTIARLYVRLGQFYFARANSLKRTAIKEKENNEPATVHPEDPWSSLCRGGLYLQKAVHVDFTDPVALRALGVILMHNAIWKKEDKKTPGFDKDILAHSRLFIDQSLRNNAAEPGARFAHAWLLVRDDPPDFQAAIKDLAAIIDNRDNLSTLHRKKFLDICYLNRANYTAKVLRQSTPTDDQKKVALESITKDLQEGMNVAKYAGKEASYKADVKKETIAGGDLELVYPEIKSAVDSLLTT